MIRASAVGLLYSMATKQSSPEDSAEQSPLSDLVFEHFNTAINLETNREVLNLLRARLTDLASFRPSLQVIRDSNLEAQRELIRILADLFAVRGAGDPAEITLDDWSAASFATGLPKRALQTLTHRFNSASSAELTQGKYFAELLRTARDRASLLSPPALAAEGEQAINSAGSFSQRLQVNAELWTRCFARPQAAGELGLFSELFLNGITVYSKVLNSVQIENVQMQDAQISETRLDGASLRFAYLEGTKFLGVDLSGADLTGAHLEGTTAGWNTNFDGTKLHLAHIDAATDFSTLWLKANYREADVIFTNASASDSFRLFSDKKLLDQLFSKWIRLHASLKASNPVRLISDISNRSAMMRFQEELKSAHPSVREYVQRFCPQLFDPIAPPAT